MVEADIRNAWGSSCLICGSSHLIQLLSMPPVPVLSNQLCHDADKARNVERAPIVLVGCDACGHLFNRAFDPAAVKYHEAYENSLMGSPRYRQYTSEIIDHLWSRRDLTGGTAVEVGCGRGEFLQALCARGIRRAVGFDPGRQDEITCVGNATLTIIGGPFERAAAPKTADLVCARHVLEHLHDPVSLLVSLRSVYSASPACVYLIEVPNGCYTVERLGIWDLIYEHVSYFTPPSLSRALAMAGLAAHRIKTTFGDQFLLAEAEFDGQDTGAAVPYTPADVTAHFPLFRTAFVRTLDEWERWLHSARRNGRRLALWGAGAKGTTFLNLVDHRDDRAVTQVVDVNPLKAGAFVIGTGHPIVPPAELCRSRPDAILLMNPEYQGEVRQQLQDLGLQSELMLVSGERPPAE